MCVLNYFIPRLCCLCAEAPLWAWCGMGICLWAILITSRNGKCLMCSGEVIDIDLCCGGLWRGSIIAGSRQSQLCIIRLPCVCLHVCLCICVWILWDFWQWSSMETSHIIRESWQTPPPPQLLLIILLSCQQHPPSSRTTATSLSCILSYTRTHTHMQNKQALTHTLTHICTD